MKSIKIMLFLVLSLSSIVVFGACDYPSDLDSRGYKCGGRAASVIPGGRLGGDGHYTDSYGRPRIYGRDNDIYDKPTYGNPRYIKSKNCVGRGC